MKSYKRPLYTLILVLISSLSILTSNAFAVNPGELDTNVNSPYSYWWYHNPTPAPDSATTSDNKLLLVSTSSSLATVSKFNEDGTLDTGFASSGTYTFAYVSPYYMQGKNIAVSKNDDIYVTVRYYSGGTSNYTLNKFSSSGVLDSSFASTGGSDLSMPGNIDVTIGNDNKIYATYAYGTSVYIKRFLSSGSLDTSYGSSGIVTLSSSSLVQSNSFSNIIIYNNFPFVDGTDKIIIRRSANTFSRLNYDGSIDTSYGSSGLLTANLSKATINDKGQVFGYSDTQVSKYKTSSGDLDTSFGTSGTATISTSLTDNGQLNTITFNNDGGILIVYKTVVMRGLYSTDGTTFVMLDNDGSPDTRFGASNNGKFAWQFANTYSMYGFASYTSTPTTLAKTNDDYVWFSGQYSIVGRLGNTPQPNISQRNLGMPINGNPAYAGDPVNITNGNVYNHEQDFSIEGVGPSLTWLRTYNSQSNVSSHMGNGWVHDFMSSLRFNSDSSITELTPQGAQVTFPSLGGNTWDSPDGILDEITYASSYYYITKPNQVKWKYNSSGQLVSIIDGNNDALTLSYTSGKLTTLTNESGRSLTISYTGNLISSIEDDDNNTYEYDYDSDNNLTSVTDPRGKITTYEYYPNNLKLKKIIKPGVTGNPGNTQEFTYDLSGRATSSEGSNNAHSQTYEYDTPSSGKTTVTDANGDTIYTHDENGFVTSIKDPYNKTISYEWTNGLKTSETDQIGNETTYEYNSNGSLSSVTRPIPSSGGSHPVTNYTYADSSYPFNVTKIEDPEGNETNYTYDSYGNKLTETNARGNTTTYTYNSHGQVTSIETPNDDNNGTSTTFSYEADGDLASITRPPRNSGGNSTTTTYDYDILGRKISETTDMGKETEYEYDENSNVTKITEPEMSSSGSRRTTTYTYDPRGNVLTKQINAASSGPTTTYTYDEQNNIKSVTSPSGKTTSYTYNRENNILTITDNDGNETTNTYDDVERLATTNVDDGTTGGGAGATTIYDYLDNGLVNSITDPRGKVTEYGYDNLGRLTSVTDANNNSTSNTYDQNGNLLSSEDLNGKTTSYEYDENGNIVKKTLPGLTSGSNSREITYEYDDNDNKVKQTDVMGKQTNYVYNQLDEIKEMNFPSSLTPTLEWTYNDDGQVVTTTDGTGVTNYDYNDRGDLITKNLPTSIGGSGNHEIEYEYNSLGQLTSVKAPDATSTTEYEYNDDGQVDKLTNPNNDDIIYNYNSVGLLSSTVYASGAKNSYEYDEMGRTIQTKNYAGDGSGGLGTKRNEFNYEYDKNSNLKKIIDKNSNEANFTYDDVNRLTHQEYDADFMISGAPSVDETRSYDPGGNLTQKVSSGSNVASTETTDYTYNARDELTQADNDVQGVTNYSYDDNGRMTGLDPPGSSNDKTLVYNTLNQIISMGSEAYEYDINGRKVKHTDNVSNDVHTFVLDEMGNMLQDNTNGGSVNTGANPGTATPATTNYAYGAEGVAEVGEQDASGAYSPRGNYLVDHMGSVVGLANATPGSGSGANASGAVVSDYSRDAWGTIIDSNEASSPAADANAQSFGYLGNKKTGLGGSNLLDFNARAYDASVGRFVSPDPVSGNSASPQTLTQYAYGENNPFLSPDPSGLFSMSQLGVDRLFSPIRNIYNDVSDLADYYQQKVSCAYDWATNHALMSIIIGYVSKGIDFSEGASKGWQSLFAIAFKSRISERVFDGILNSVVVAKQIGKANLAAISLLALVEMYSVYKSNRKEGNSTAKAFRNATVEVGLEITGAVAGSRGGAALGIISGEALFPAGGGLVGGAGGAVGGGILGASFGKKIGHNITH